MKVALVVTPPPSFTKIYWCEAESSVNTQLPPLDLLYISSYLEKHDIETEVVDSSQLSSEFDYYVFHVSRQTLETDLEVVMNCHLVGKTIIFGCDVSANPKFWSKYKFVDYIVLDEPEAKILGLVTRKAPQFLNLNGLYPNYKKVDINKYKCSYIKAKPFVLSLSSRGCPHSCIFCSSHIMFGRAFRRRAAYDVAVEMKHYQSIGVKTLWFYDDTFTMDRQRVLDICGYIKELDVNLFWKTQTRADCLDKKLLETLRDSRCYELGIGVESGNQKILALNGKGLSLKKVKQTFKDCNDIGMQTVAFFMLGMAHETQKTVNDTIEFAKSLDPTYAQFVLATPYRGTEFYDLAKINGWLVHEESTCTDSYGLRMNDLTPEIMEDKLKQANRSFYMRPRYLFKQLRHPSLEKVKSLLDVIT